MSAKPQEPISGRGYKLRKVAGGHPLSDPYAENVSVGVVDCARVKDVLGVSVRPRSQGRGYRLTVLYEIFLYVIFLLIESFIS